MSNVSPYTRVIAECLHSLSDDKSDNCECDTKQVMQLLINMLQGRMLEHIKERVSSYYKIEQDALNETEPVHPATVNVKNIFMRCFILHI